MDGPYCRKNIQNQSYHLEIQLFQGPKMKKMKKNSPQLQNIFMNFEAFFNFIDIGNFMQFSNVINEIDFEF